MTPDKDKIRRLRKAKGWTQERLSTETGLSKRIVQKAEAGDSVAAYSLEQFAYALGVSVKDLCKQELVQNPITLAFHLADDLPEDVAHFFSLIQKSITDYKVYKANKRPINVYFIPGTNNNGEDTYVYALVHAGNHKEFMRLLNETGEIADFAVLVEYGKGKPTEVVKKKMLDWYGFDHDAMERGDKPKEV